MVHCNNQVVVHVVSTGYCKDGYKNALAEAHVLYLGILRFWAYWSPLKGSLIGREMFHRLPLSSHVAAIPSYRANLVCLCCILIQGGPVAQQPTNHKYTQARVHHKRCPAGHLWKGEGTCLPITPAVLCKLKGSWEQLPCGKDAVMFWAASCLCFFGFLRMGEIVD